MEVSGQFYAPAALAPVHVEYEAVLCTTIKGGPRTR